MKNPPPLRPGTSAGLPLASRSAAPPRALPHPALPPRFFLGLDFGQRQDYSALAILERTSTPTGEFDHALWRPVTRLSLALRYLHRWPLNTPYLQVLQDTTHALRRLPARQPHPILALDAAGPGAPITEILRQARLPAALEPVLITSGHQPSSPRGGAILVPRAYLLTQLRLCLERHDLHLSPALPLLPPLLEELAALGQPTPAQHDDLALSLALALHAALRHTPALRSSS